MKKVLYGTYYKPEGGESQTENGNIPQNFRNTRQNRRPERVKIFVEPIEPVGQIGYSWAFEAHKSLILCKFGS